MLNRRQFLRAPLILPVLRAGAAPAPSDTIGLACIGIGWQGTNNVQSFLEEPACRVLAVCDVDRRHLQAAKQMVDDKYGNRDCAAYTRFEEVLARTGIDAVMLAVPDHWHGALAMAALRAGKDVYGEKPVAHNFAEGRAIVDAVARFGRVWQTGSWQRSVAQFRQACELVRNGRIGKVRRVEVGLPGGLIDYDGLANQDTPMPVPDDLDYDRWLGPAPDAPYCPARVHKTWRWNLDYGGGLLMDWIGHHLDIAHWGLGLDETGPTEVEGRGEFPVVNRIWNAPAKFRVDAAYAGGLTILISGGYDDVRSGVKWIGDEGWIWVDRSGLEANPRNVLTSRIRPNEIHLPRSASHHRQFLECVRTRGRTVSPAAVSLRSVTPGYLGLISMQVGRKVRWDPARQAIVGDPAAERLLSRPARRGWAV